MTEVVKPWRLAPRTIRGLAIAFAAISALITAILGITTFVAVHHEIERQIDARIASESDALLDYEHDHGFDALVTLVNIRDRRAMPNAIGYLSGVDNREGRAIRYILIDRSGRRVAGTLEAQIPPAGWSEFLKIRRPDGSFGDAQVLNSALTGGGRLIVIGDRHMLHRTDRLLFQLFAAAFGSLLLVGGLMVLAFGRIVSRRISALEMSATSILAGDLSQRLPSDGSRVELDRLSQLLNRLLDHIGQLIDNQRRVSEGIAHDLRTPLSRVRAKLEQALAATSDSRQRHLLETAIDDSDSLLALFGSLLAIAEVDSRTVRSRFVDLDLADAVTQIAEAYRPALEDQGIQLAVEADHVAVRGDRVLLQRLVANALDNILSHAKSASHATVRLAWVGAEAVLRISDNGPGIANEQRGLVFERLVRLDPARSQTGHGLGLDMVRAIVAAHDGTVQVLESDGGFVLEIRLTAR